MRWGLLGGVEEGGLVVEGCLAQTPAVDQPVMGQIGYHIHSGGHDLAECDWEQYLDFADRHLGR